MAAASATMKSLCLIIVAGALAFIATSQKPNLALFAAVLDLYGHSLPTGYTLVRRPPLTAPENGACRSGAALLNPWEFCRF